MGRQAARPWAVGQACSLCPPPPDSWHGLQGNVFVNEYLIIKDLGRGAHGSVKLCFNTVDGQLYAMKVRHICAALAGQSTRMQVNP